MRSRTEQRTEIPAHDVGSLGLGLVENGAMDPNGRPHTTPMRLPITRAQFPFQATVHLKGFEERERHGLGFLKSGALDPKPYNLNHTQTHS